MIAGWLALAACSQEVVELVDASARDTGEETEDTGVVDTGNRDAEAPDLGMQDAEAPDMGTPDMGTPDSGMACVCRYVRCSNNADCDSRIGSGSTCGAPRDTICSGAIGTCTIDRECGVDFMCTTSSTTLDPC